MLTSKHPKAKTCEVCERVFVPDRMGQLVCRPACAMARVRQAKKAEREGVKARKEAIKPRAKWLAECQAIVNRYVRLLALSRGEGCYTCGATPEQKFGGTYDAGHFRSVGSAPHLRYWIPQIKLQCIPCNRHKGGMALAFRERLVRDHGDEWVNRLEAMQHMNVIVHCFAGLCRSGAVAEVGIMLGFNPPDCIRFPNSTVKNKMLKALGMKIDESTSVFSQEFYNREFD